MTASTWLTLLTTFTLAVISPGPDFLATLRMTLSRGRSRGIATGIGIGTGTSLWAVGTMAGVVALISRSETAFFAVRLVGAVFLAGYGIRILASLMRARTEAPSKGTDEEPAPPSSEPYPAWKAFRLGFLTTTVGNPKAVIFFTTLFASMLPPSITFLEGGALTLVMVAISSCWFTAVALAASMPAFVRGYERLHKPIDAALGGLFVVLGAALIPWGTLFT